jgi:hypothetical protein
VQPPTNQRAPRLWLPLLGVVVVTAAAGYTAREIYRPHPESQATPSVVVTSSSTPPPTEQPGAREVTATQDVASHPQYQAIRQMLQDYFDAINAKDYGKWRGTVTKLRADNQPESKWRAEYQSTRDGNILVYRIGAAPERKLRVLVGFTSKQDLTNAPTNMQKECINWHVVLSVTKEDNRWRIDWGPESGSPQFAECGTQTS